MMIAFNYNGFVKKLQLQSLTDVRLFNKRAPKLQKENDKDETKLDELEQYDSRLNLEFDGVLRETAKTALTLF